MGSQTATYRLAAALALAAAAAALAACGGGAQPNDNDSLIAGKKAFFAKCGSCHVLARAGTKGTIGPNLDQAFIQARKSGFKESAIYSVTLAQISDANRTGVMPRNLVKGHTAKNVAAYVAKVAGAGSTDSGLLASAVPQAGAGKPIAEKAGTLTIAADPNGALAFVSNKATATAGKITFTMPNMSATQHNIALMGPGTPHGAIISKGGTSTFSATLKAGSYTYFCQVPGHLQAGMKGTVTVK